MVCRPPPIWPLWVARVPLRQPLPGPLCRLPRQATLWRPIQQHMYIAYSMNIGSDHTALRPTHEELLKCVSAQCEVACTSRRPPLYTYCRSLRIPFRLSKNPFETMSNGTGSRKSRYGRGVSPSWHCQFSWAYIPSC